MSHVVEMAGKRYGMLTVISQAQSTKDGMAKWNCLCDCGNQFEATGGNIRFGTTKSCGCYMAINASKQFKTHGMSKKRIYHTWASMKARCLNPNCKEYKFYGARGIAICKDWKNAALFIDWAMKNGYKDNLTIERIDANGNYEPSNCTFIPLCEQGKNTRRTIRIITNNGHITTNEAAQLTGVHRATISRWYCLGLIETLNDAKKLANRKEWKLCKK